MVRDKVMLCILSNVDKSLKITDYLAYVNNVLKSAKETERALRSSKPI